jgi:hypothetical protein
MKLLLILVVTTLFFLHQKQDSPQKSISRIMKAQKAELRLADKRIEYGNTLLKALPIDKLIEYSDKQDARLAKEHEARKAKWGRKW